MLKENCRVGMKVRFGRPNGEKTLGIVRKLNVKKAAVQILEDRGSRTVAGDTWSVPYSMLTQVDAAEVVDAPEPIKYNPFDVVENHVMSAIFYCYMQLEPEALSCDGEASISAMRSRAAKLRGQLTALMRCVGREVSESQAWDWDKAREEYHKKQKSA